jgi:hypothetical protein
VIASCEHDLDGPEPVLRAADDVYRLVFDDFYAG